MLQTIQPSPTPTRVTSPLERETLFSFLWYLASPCSRHLLFRHFPISSSSGTIAPHYHCLFNNDSLPSDHSSSLSLLPASMCSPPVVAISPLPLSLDVVPSTSLFCLLSLSLFPLVISLSLPPPQLSPSSLLDTPSLFHASPFSYPFPTNLLSLSLPRSCPVKLP